PGSTRSRRNSAVSTFSPRKKETCVGKLQPGRLRFEIFLRQDFKMSLPARRHSVPPQGTAASSNPQSRGGSPNPRSASASEKPCSADDHLRRRLEAFRSSPFTTSRHRFCTRVARSAPRFCTHPLLRHARQSSSQAFAKSVPRILAGELTAAGDHYRCQP